MNLETTLGLILASFGTIGLLIQNINWSVVKSKTKELL